MTGQQTLVGVGGAALVLLNFWTSEARSVVSGGIFNPGGDVQAAHRTLTVIGGELLFVVVATVLAGLSDSWGTVMVVTVVGLFVLWAMNHFAGGLHKPQAQTGPTGVVKGAA